MYLTTTSKRKKGMRNTFMAAMDNSQIKLKGRKLVMESMRWEALMPGKNLTCWRKRVVTKPTLIKLFNTCTHDF